MLDNFFRGLDMLCSQHGVQKIETVGKTYLACAGLRTNERFKEEQIYLDSNPVKSAIEFAYDSLEFIKTISLIDNKKLELKIGIHYGRVIAGVIGYHKPQFSLIGDTVNTTSRVCTTGDPQTITISDKAYAMV